MKGLRSIWSLVIVICTFVSCSALNTISNKLTPPFISTKSDLVRTVYIDKSFGENEDAIIEGLKLWECRTNGMVRFTIVRDYDVEHPNMVIDPATSILVKRVDSNNQIIRDEDRKMAPSGFFTLGVYIYDPKNNDPATIILCSERVYGAIVYKALTTHEAGHALHLLKHSLDKGSVMFETIGSNKITDDDLKTFCDLYDCDSTQFKSKCE